jgi:hypothetical protein
MNQINVIHPYKHEGQWVFTDSFRGLIQEPFVSGMDNIIDEMVKGMENPEDGFNLLFSANMFPDFTVTLSRLHEDHGGYWYECPELNMIGWLCPAMFKYFDQAPVNIYAKVKE